MKHVLVAFNPASRLKRGQLDQLLERSVPAGVNITVLETSAEETIASSLRMHLEEASLVVAVGGDGTVSAAAAAILGTGIPLGIVPAGSTNMIAKVGGIPSNPAQALALIFGDHQIATIDAGRCNGRVLLHIGGAGLDARIFQRTSSALKRRLRWAGYAPSALLSARQPASRMAITVDGSVVQVNSRLMLIANSASLIHRAFKLLPDVRRDDGMFDVIIFTADDATSIVRTLTNVVTLRAHRSAHILHLQGRTISVEADPPLPFELDGDVIGETPFRVDVVPNAVNLICGKST